MATVPFGPYELVHRLGSGGMAETFLAVRRGPGGFVQHVCVKRILPAFEADPGFVAEFMEEARLAARLRHGNITQVVDFGAVGGSHYLALELVDGVDLRTLLARLTERGERLDPAMVTHVGLELASALDAAHQGERERPPIVHRDVSPSNVLVSRAGEVYLTDFGIARVVGAKRRTDSGVVKGKVPYMAPEYAMTGRFDGRTDLFGLGVLLFEALAGERPYRGRTELDTLRRIQAGEHPPLASLAPGVDERLVAIIEHLIRPAPEERFASAAALLDALATCAPPATVSRDLGALVRDGGESLSRSLELSGALPTAAVAVEPAPAMPHVRPSDPGAATRTRPAPEMPVKTGGMWSATDPTRVSHHDQPSPLVSVAGSLSDQPSPLIPATNVALPASVAPDVPRPRSPILWIVLAALGVAFFAAAGVGAYFLVSVLRGS